MTTNRVAANQVKEEVYSLYLQGRKQSDWRERVARLMPPMLPTLFVMLAVTAFFIKDYFLLEVISVALSVVVATTWLDRHRSKLSWLTILFNRTTERISWSIYLIVAVLSVINPAFAGTAPAGSGSCSATNTILGPIADALIDVFQNSAQVGSTGEISDNLCQVFTTFAAIIALLIIGSILWGLFDNQVRGSDLGKAFAPLGLVLAGVVITRISIKLVMGV